TKVVHLEHAGARGRGILLGSGLLRRSLRGGILLGGRLLRERLLLDDLFGRLVGLLSHQSISSTFTRWATVLTYPRVCESSGRTTESPIRLRPRLRSVSRWFCFSLTLDLIWVTLRRAAIRHLPSAQQRPWPRCG